MKSACCVHELFERSMWRDSDKMGIEIMYEKMWHGYLCKSSKVCILYTKIEGGERERERERERDQNFNTISICIVICFH